MKIRIIGASVLALALVGVTPALVANATPAAKVAICHATGSESNPWELIEVPEPALGAHEGHGDLIPAPAAGCPAPVVVPPVEPPVVVVPPVEPPVVVTPPVEPPVVTPPVVEPPTAPVQTITLIAWEMPTWINSTTPSWPQSYETSVVQTAANLNALDASLPCGSQFQIDANLTVPGIAEVIAGGVLNGPGDPFEALIPGGWGVAYKLIQTPACVVHVPVVEQHEESVCTSTTDYTTRTWTTTDGVVSNEASSTRTLDRTEAIALGCYTPPVVECEPGTVPGWLNEFGDATSCVGDNPCPEVEFGQPCPGDVPPVVTPPTEVTPVVDASPLPAKLAYTGTDSGMLVGGLVVGGLGLAVGIALIVGSALRRRSTLEV